MGVAGWWFGCFITDEDYDKIMPYFSYANEKACLTKEQEQAIEFWKHHSTEIDWMNIETGKNMNEFLCSFNLPGFAELAASFCSTTGMFGDFLNEKTVFRFIMTNRNTPGALLWHALGYERAKQLPGKMGNLILHRIEIEKALKEVQKIYQHLSTEALIKKAKLFSGMEVSDDEIRNIITMLPDGLTKALEQKTGMIFLARRQL